MAGNTPVAQSGSDQLASRPPPRMGVFICECGDKVVSALEMETLINGTAKLPDVVHAARAPYWCSADGRERLLKTIRGLELDRIIVAGCSPRTHESLFRETAADAGLAPGLVRMVNIREGCAWPHRDVPEAATVRAVDQIVMEVARMATLTSHPISDIVIAPAALVIGGGVAGLTAALELAHAGVPVTLIERTSTLGGTAIAQAPELAADLASDVETHPGIELHLGSQIIQVDGSVGNYCVDAVHHTSHVAHHGPFGVIVVATGAPDERITKLAKLLRLPQDVGGFIPEPRVRLRPGSYTERGIYVCGSAHYPCDAAEAQFQAYSAASRALRHLGRGKVTVHGPAAQVDPTKCNGCGDCLKVCPFSAVTMDERIGRISLSAIDSLLCTGCGNCISICPVGAVTVAGWTDTQIEAQMRIALAGISAPAANSQPRILVFACEWSGYAAAELAGARQLTYPSNIRMIRLDCGGRLQPGLILKAFELGVAGVLVLACEPRLCHYERGNERAAVAFGQVEAITGLLGLSPGRLKLGWTPPDDGPAFADLVTQFVEVVEEAEARNTQHAVGKHD
jgi:heterodisulfide reductase subunit A-like polyferredoxin/coenzyme F420-reducing hydrogenase delta subunit